MQAEKTENGDVKITMTEQQARDLKELTGGIIRDEAGLHIPTRDEAKQMRLYKSAYAVSGALFELL